MKLLPPEDFCEEIKLYGFKKLKDKVYTVLLPSFLVQFDNGKSKAFNVETHKLKGKETMLEAVKRISNEFKNCYYFFYETSLIEEKNNIIKYVRVEENVEV